MNLKELVLVILPLIMVSTFEGSYGLYSDEVVITGKRGSYQAALDHCKSIGMKLIRVKSEEDNSLLTSLAVARGIGRFWVDGNDIKIEGTWVNSHGWPLEYKKWHGGEPNNWGGNEDCAEVFYFGNSDWNDIICTTDNGIICFNDRRNRNGPSNALSSEQITITGKRGTFQAAQDHCKSIGLRLVRVESEEDNNLVTALAVGKSIGRFWVDGNDIKIEGTWVNSDNSLLTYKKWHGGEPNNWGGNEDCAEVFYFGNSDWNDIICSTNNGIICMSDFGRDTYQTTNYELLALPDKTNYDDAVTVCKGKNLALVKGNSETVNKLVYDFAVKNSLGAYWIDLNDNANEGSWVTSDGSSATYRNFANGEPNGGRGENCVHGLFYKDALWNDVACGNQYTVICYRVY